MVFLMTDDESLPLEEIMTLIRSFVAERNWETFHKPSALAVSASVEMGELLEKFQWLTNEEIIELLENEEYREGLADEIADVIIYLLRLCEVTGIKPTTAILNKLKKNELKYPANEWRDKIPDKVRNRCSKPRHS